LKEYRSISAGSVDGLIRRVDGGQRSGRTSDLCPSIYD
jgi:hypothetical protein